MDDSIMFRSCIVYSKSVEDNQRKFFHNKKERSKNRYAESIVFIYVFSISNITKNIIPICCSKSTTQNHIFNNYYLTLFFFYI